jgi:hypothetical protein
MIRIVRVIVTMVPTWLALGSILSAFSFPAQAQEPTKSRRIGVLGHGIAPAESAPTNVKTFHEGLRELGYIVGKNVMIEYRYAEKDRGEKELERFEHGRRRWFASKWTSSLR